MPSPRERRTNGFHGSKGDNLKSAFLPRECVPPARSEKARGLSDSVRHVRCSQAYSAKHGAVPPSSPLARSSVSGKNQALTARNRRPGSRKLASARRLVRRSAIHISPSGSDPQEIPDAAEG